MLAGRTLIVGLSIIFIGGIGAHWSKTVTDERIETLKTINSKIKKEQELINTLGADWAYLTRPSRIQSLAQEMLTFAPIPPERILPLDALEKKTPANKNSPLYRIRTLETAPLKRGEE